MKHILAILAATMTLAIAAPASAQVYFGAGPGGVEVGVGDGYGYGYRHRYWRHRYYDAYASDCRVIRERTVTWDGRVIYRSRQVCY